jgi:hypothetical protein
MCGRFEAAHETHRIRRSEDAQKITAIRTNNEQRVTPNAKRDRHLCEFQRVATNLGERKWRKCMGIEPTCDALNAPHDGFEDRGRHQAYKHFRLEKVFAANGNAVSFDSRSENSSFAGQR